MFLSSPSDLKVDWLTFSVTVAAGDSFFFLSVPFFQLCTTPFEQLWFPFRIAFTILSEGVGEGQDTRGNFVCAFPCNRGLLKRNGWQADEHHSIMHLYAFNVWSLFFFFFFRSRIDRRGYYVVRWRGVHTSPNCRISMRFAHVAQKSSWYLD